MIEKEKDSKKPKGFGLLMWLLRGVAHLPLRVLYIISDVAFFILYHVVHYRRKVVVANLRLAFPKASDEEIRKWEHEFYHHLCDIFIESVKLLHISDSEVDKRIDIRDAELVDAAVRRGHSVVLMLGHYGNWEWVTSICRKFREPVVTSQIYHPLANRLFDEVMLAMRGRFGAESIPMKMAIRRLLQIEQSGEKFVCGFIADQRPLGTTLHHWTDFFGIDTPYMVGGESIGAHVGAEYLYVDVEKMGRGRYRLTFRPIIPPASDKDENPVTREYMRMLEQTIRRAPAYWLWSHKRWKRHRENQNNSQDS